MIFLGGSVLEDELNGGNERQLIEEDLGGIVARLKHPDHVISSPKKIAEIWGTALNNYSELHRRYSHYFTPEGITISNLVAMSKESFRNPRNPFKGEEFRQRQAARIKRIGDYDMGLDGAASTNGIAEAASQEQSSSLTLYQDVVKRQQKRQIDPDVVIYSPFMRPEDVAMAPRQTVYHPNPKWAKGTTVEEMNKYGTFTGWGRDKKTGAIVHMFVRFPSVGVMRLAVNYDSDHYHNSNRLDPKVWGGYVQPSVTARR